MPTTGKSLLQCQTREQLAILLEVSLPTLTYFAYGSGRRYSRFDIAKKSGGARTITTPVGALMEIQRKLAEHFEAIYPNPPYVHGFMAGRSVLTNATPHLNKRQVFNIDLQDFFPSITSGRIFGLLRAKPFNFNDEVASTIAGLVCYGGSLPQGAPTSPVLSNMICLRLDKALYRLCRQYHVTYTRYADDLTFSARGELPEFIVTLDEANNSLAVGGELSRLITSNFFEINPLKTRLSKNGQAKYVTGVKVNVLPNLAGRYVRQLRAALHAWERYGLADAQRHWVEKYGGGNRKLENVIRGRLAYLKSIKSETDPVYAKLYNRFIRLEGRGRPELSVTDIERLQHRVFVVESGANRGTGFIMDDKWLVTCSHVAKQAPVDTEYFTYNNFARATRMRERPSESFRSDIDEYDMIAFPVDTRRQALAGKSFESLPEGVEVAAGENLKILGFPAYAPGTPPHMMTVEVTVLRENNGILNAYVDKKMIGGFSGSPVLNSSNQVVGIVQRGTDSLQTGDDSIGYTFLPIQEMRKYFRKYLDED